MDQQPKGDHQNPTSTKKKKKRNRSKKKKNASENDVDSGKVTNIVKKFKQEINLKESTSSVVKNNGPSKGDKSELNSGGNVMPKSGLEKQVKGTSIKVQPRSDKNSHKIEQSDKKREETSPRTDSKKKKKKSQGYLNCPRTIMDAVLLSGTKELNLSQKLENRLRQNQVIDYLKNTINYDTDRINMIPVDMMTVLPRKFQNIRVNLDPFAITKLNCINEMPQKRRRLRGKKKKRGVQAGKDDNQAGTSGRGGLDQNNLEKSKDRPKEQKDSTEPKNVPNESEKVDQRPCFPNTTHYQDPYVLRWLT